MLDAKLTIAGQPVELSAIYSLRFYHDDKTGVEPVLYKDGKRVTKDWTLTGTMSREGNPLEDSGNTA